MNEGVFLAIGLFNGYILLLPVFTILVLRSKRRSLSLLLIVLGFGCILTIGVTFAPPSAAQIPGEAVYYYHVDHLQTPIALTDASGTPVWSAIFSPFMGSNQQSGSVTQPLRYPGQYHDQETGLFYNMNRYYAPSLGRYIQHDPLEGDNADFEDPLSWNQYSYVQNNPILSGDPSGLFSIDSNCKQCNGPDISPSINRSCNDVDRTITDLILRRCIKRSCQTGSITCSKSDCNIQFQGGKPLGVAIIPNPGESPNRNITLCPQNGSNNDFGSIAVHEWAHGCGWRHNGGKGVPYQGGYGGLTGIPRGSYPLGIPIISGIKIYDFITKFTFTGRVIDVNSKKGINKVKVYFVDTGYDYVASKMPRKYMKNIGQTSTDGTFSKSWDYFWGFEKGHEPKGTFELEFQKKGYYKNVKKYFGTSFTSSGNNIFADFGIIEMKKAK